MLQLRQDAMGAAVHDVIQEAATTTQATMMELGELNPPVLTDFWD